MVSSCHGMSANLKLNNLNSQVRSLPAAIGNYYGYTDLVPCIQRFQYDQLNSEAVIPGDQVNLDICPILCIWPFEGLQICNRHLLCPKWPIRQRWHALRCHPVHLFMVQGPYAMGQCIHWEWWGWRWQFLGTVGHTSTTSLFFSSHAEDIQGSACRLVFVGHGAVWQFDWNVDCGIQGGSSGPAYSHSCLTGYHPSSSTFDFYLWRCHGTYWLSFHGLSWCILHLLC